MADTEMTKQLNRQLAYLRRSAAAFDEGEQDEAVRIATAIRVLIHHTAKSSALLNQMGARTSVRLLSTVQPFNPHLIMAAGPVSIVLSSHGPAKVVPLLSRGGVRLLMSIDEWWNQVICIQGQLRPSRRDIVLGSANKDGGAHVDVNDVPATFASLKTGIWTTGPLEEMIAGKVPPMPDHHFVILRQFAFEILESPDIAALA